MEKTRKRAKTKPASRRPKSPLKTLDKSLKKLDKPLKKLDKKVIAQRPTRRYRARVFQAYVYVGSIGFVVLAMAARSVPHFAIDLKVTRALQSYHGPMFDYLMFSISWIGFQPQSIAFGLIPVIILFSMGLRWEAIATLIAVSSVVLAGVVKALTDRPRPGIDLVKVFSELDTSSFPSGHVLSTTTLCGFLAFLTFTLLKPSAGRTALLVFFTLLVVLMGPSRIYQGQHWFSDVMGAYLLATIWLGVTITIYRWGKPRFFTHQPVAPETPAAQTT